MTYASLQEKQTLLKWKSQVKAYNDAINAMEAIKPLAGKFDGKTITKRFTNALNKLVDESLVSFSLVSQGYSCTRHQNIKQIVLLMHDRVAKVRAAKVDDIGDRVHIDDNTITVYEVDNGSEFPCYINAEGRLNGEVFVRALDKAIGKCRDAIGRYQKRIDNFDVYLSKIRDINRQISELKKEIQFPMTIYPSWLELPFVYQIK